MLNTFTDVFQLKLPPGIPSERGVDHEIILNQVDSEKLRAISSLLDEQDASDFFVAYLLKKNWFQVLDFCGYPTILECIINLLALEDSPSRLECYTRAIHAWVFDGSLPPAGKCSFRSFQAYQDFHTIY